MLNKSFFRKLFKKILLAIVYFLGALITYIIVIFILSAITVNETPSSADDEITIYILSNGVHTDIVVPTSTELIDWSSLIKYENSSSQEKGLPLLAIGWGDKGFYLNTPTWGDLTFKTAFKAVSGLSTSAMHCTYYSKLSKSDQCIPLKISKKEYQALIDFIRESFLIEENNPIYIPNEHYGVNDSFYEAKGTYNIAYTCNTWSNQALKACNQKACLWTLFDFAILNKYDSE